MRFFSQHLRYRCLEACGDIRDLFGNAGRFFQVVETIQDSCLEATEAEVEPGVGEHRSGEIETAGVALQGGLLDRRSARIFEAQYFGNLVKGFTGGVVTRAS